MVIMYGSYGAHGFFRKYVLFLAIQVDYPFWKSTVRGVHSLDQFKRKYPVRHIDKKVRKSVNSSRSNDVDPKVYMRDTIGNISKILRYSSWDSAQEQLEKLPVRWDSYTINQVLKTHPPMEKAWLFFNWASHLKGFKHDQFTYTTMLDIFGEAGRISSMNYVFQQMQEKGIKIDAVTYTSLLHWLSKDGDIDGSVQVWKEMKATGCRPTVVSYTAYMKVLFDNNRVKEATDIYKEMLQSGYSPNCWTYTVLMEYLVGSGKYKAALEIFCKMQEAGVQPDKAACNILIEKFCTVGQTWAMLEILRYMKENSLVLRYAIYVEAFGTLKSAGESDVLLRQVNPHFSIECGDEEEITEFEANFSDIHVTVDGGLVLNFLKKQNFIAVDRILTGMIDKNIQLHSSITSSIIELNSAHDRMTGCLLAFEYSVKMGIKIRRTAYLALVGILIRTDSFPKVVGIVEEMIGAGHPLGTYMAASLIYRLGRARRPLFAANIFNMLPHDEKNSATYTAFIGAYFFAGSIDKGLQIYETMRSKGLRPALGTYNMLLAGLAKFGRVQEAEIFRKERKSLQADIHSLDSVSDDEKICNILFAGATLS